MSIIDSDQKRITITSGCCASTAMRVVNVAYGPEVVNGIAEAAAGSSALRIYRLTPSWTAYQEHVDELWRATKDAVADATPFFTEPISPEYLFTLLFRLTRSL